VAPESTVENAILKRLDSIEEDMKILRDNHLAHIEKDMASMTTDLAVINTRLGPIEKFTETWTQKIMVMFIGAVGVAIGLPLVM